MPSLRYLMCSMTLHTKLCYIRIIKKISPINTKIALLLKISIQTLWRRILINRKNIYFSNATFAQCLLVSSSKTLTNLIACHFSLSFSVINEPRCTWCTLHLEEFSSLLDFLSIRSILEMMLRCTKQFLFRMPFNCKLISSL